MRERELKRIKNNEPAHLEVIDTTVIVSEENLVIDINENPCDMNPEEVNKSKEDDVIETTDVINGATESSEVAIEDLESTNEESDEEPTMQKEPEDIARKKSFKLYKCEKCDKRFIKRAYAKSHCKKQNWQCEKCGSEIANVQNVKRHKDRCNREKPVKVMTKPDHRCSICGMAYASNSNLLKHKRAFHDSEIGNKHCRVEGCGFSTTKEKYLKKHATSAHPNKPPIKCRKCQYECLSKSGLLKHMTDHHGVQCPYCDQVCCSEAKIKLHMSKAHISVPQTYVVHRRIGEQSRPSLEM